MKKLLLAFSMILSLFLFVSCAKDDYKLKVAGPSGAPVVAASNALDSEKQTLNLNLEASALQPLFVNGEEDIIIAPINLGANMYSKNGNYKLGAVLTWGNLFLASKAEIKSVADLEGKDLVLFGEATINDVVVKKALEGVTYNATYLGSTQATQAALIADTENKVYLVAEPALSAAKTKIASLKTLSIQDLFKAKSGNNKFAQAGVFVNVKTVEAHKSVVKDFLSDVKKSCELAKSDASALADKAIALGITTPKAVLASSIPGCNIEYVSAKDAKASVEYTANLNLKLFGGELPKDEFYYA